MSLQIGNMPCPHLKSSTTITSAMRDVQLALIPIILVSLYFFKTYAVFLIAVCMVTAVLTELSFRYFLKKPQTLHDGSALVTGLLVSMCLPSTTLWWRAALATFIAVGLAKELMGGLGWNRFNPALFGRVALTLMAPLFMALNASLEPVDVITQATPLAMLKLGMPMPSYLNLFLGFPGGALSESSVLAVILGGTFLLYRGHINWRTPAAMLGTVSALTLVLGKDPLYHLLTGGLMLGAFFMATDWVTSPITHRGKLVFSICIGILIVVFRVILAPTEGVAFSILIMNSAVPLIEKLTRSRTFGHQLPLVAQTPARQQEKGITS